MIHGGGEFIHLILAGGFVSVAFGSTVLAIYLFVLAQTRRRSHGVDDTTLFLYGFSSLACGYSFGATFVMLWTIGYAHLDWDLVNTATGLGSGALGLVSLLQTLVGLALILAPITRRVSFIGTQALQVNFLAVVMLWCAGIAVAHSGHTQLRWFAHQAGAVNTALTPDAWKNTNAAKYFAGEVKRAE